MKNEDHISVCICTYKRPHLLSQLLTELTDQKTDNIFSYSIVVVDNDHNQTAKETVSTFQKSSSVPINYAIETEANIALARNKAVQTAKGNFIAFIDDDEKPEKIWLRNMFQCLKNHNADAVLGPVLPKFSPGAPEWLKKSGLCDRPRRKTGFPITRRDMRTGNILFQRYIFDQDGVWFDLGRWLTGGGHGDFISRKLKSGGSFLWCDDGIVLETVTKERWSASFYLKRNFRIGAMTGANIRHSWMISNALKAISLLLFYSVLLPISMLAVEKSG